MSVSLRSSESIESDSNDCRTDERDSTELNKKLTTLNELIAIKEKECFEANSLLIHFFEENINLSRELNNFKTNYDLLLVDFKQQEATIKDLNSMLFEKNNEILQINNEHSNEIQKLNERIKNLTEQQKSKNESPKTSNKTKSIAILRKNSKIHHKKSIAYNVYHKIRKVYESKIVDVLNKVRKEIQPIVLNELLNVKIKTECFESNPESNEKKEIDPLLEIFSNIDIIEHNIEQKYIKIINRTFEDYSLGNYQLISYLNGIEILKYKFHKSTVLRPGKCIILWSKLSDLKKHYPPSDFIMKNSITDDNAENIIDESFLWSFSNTNNLIKDIILDQNGNKVSISEFSVKSKQEIIENN